MIDLNDVLLAMSNIPVDDPIAEIWGRGLQGGYKIIEYTGSLPITINANGDALLDYRIYGADGGVGEPTENLFDKSATATANGYEDKKVLQPNGTSPKITGEEYYFITEYIGIPNNVTNLTVVKNSLSSVSGICFYDANKEYISGSSNMSVNRPVIISCPTGAVFFRTTIFKLYIDEAMVAVGSAAPESYIPYGYKLPMMVMNNLAPPLSQWVDGYITVNGDLAPPSYRGEKSSDFIEVKPNTQYVFSIEGGAFPQGTSGAWVAGFSYRDDRTPIKRTSDDRNSPFTFLTPSETKYVRLSYRTYGELLEPRLSENFFSTPVYIGENQLGEDEYVSFSEQKIYKDVGGTLTPTDPPVPFPEIPTVDGETIIDYDGTPKPSQMYIKYKGKAVQ